MQKSKKLIRRVYSKSWQNTRTKLLLVVQKRCREKEIAEARSWWSLRYLGSEPTSRLGENQNSKKELFLKIALSQMFSFLVMLRESKNFRKSRWAWSKILDHRHSITEAPTERCSLKITVRWITRNLYNFKKARPQTLQISH